MAVAKHWNQQHVTTIGFPHSAQPFARYGACFFAMPFFTGPSQQAKRGIVLDQQTKYKQYHSRRLNARYWQVGAPVAVWPSDFGATKSEEQRIDVLRCVLNRLQWATVYTNSLCCISYPELGVWDAAAGMWKWEAKRQVTPCGNIVKHLQKT